MLYPKSNRSDSGTPIRALHWRMSCANAARRRSSASILPFVVMSVFLLFVVLGISTDFMRDFETASELSFASQSAALYALSLATNSDGSYSTTAAQANISTAITNASNAAWNLAQFGPQNNKWSKPVNFSSADLQFVNNPLDANEFFTQLTASRQGADALIQFFLPLAYANFTKSVLPLSQVSPVEIVEVFGQPATRIGAGVSGAQPATRNADFTGFATMPFAISNLQFAGASASAVGTPFTIDLVSSSTTGSVQPGHIRGCFVNVSSSGNSTGNYYGSVQGNQAINQLIALVTYTAGGKTSIIPTNVECGSLLGAFDPNSFTPAQQAAILQAVQQLPFRYYMVPVLLTDPVLGMNTNTVVGFARMQLTAINLAGGNIASLTMNIGESVPLRNVSSATGFSTVFNTSNTPMPAPVPPFLPRQYDYASGGITPRPSGVVLAPALSPRIITPSKQG